MRDETPGDAVPEDLLPEALGGPRTQGAYTDAEAQERRAGRGSSSFSQSAQAEERKHGDGHYHDTHDINDIVHDSSSPSRVVRPTIHRANLGPTFKNRSHGLVRTPASDVARATPPRPCVSRPSQNGEHRVAAGGCGRRA